MHTITLADRASPSFIELFPDYPEVFVQLLYNRNLKTKEEVENFLKPEYRQLHNPFLFKDMEKAVNRVFKAIPNQLIAVHGDYDADGVSGAVILQTVLDVLGARSIIYIPHKEREGYGLNLETIKYLHNQKVNLIITCDCGISNKVEVESANQFGIDSIITDHHQVPDALPRAAAIIHPGVKDEPYPFKELAGGGVAFKLAQALLRSNQSGLSDEDIEKHEKWLLDLVALSTVADMVNLIDENRVLTRFGLLVMSKTRRKGLQNLFALAKIDANTLTTESISYRIAPRINAAGRMDHANAAYLLLKTDSDHTAEKLAELLEVQNKERQVRTERMYQEALREINDSDAIHILFKDTWQAGLTGLVAGRLVKSHNKPTFIMCGEGGQIMGSGRGPEGTELVHALDAVQDHLASYGGHPRACGYRFDPSLLSTVTDGLREHFKKIGYTPLQEPTLKAESTIEPSDISWKLATLIQLLRPFGQGNKEPLLYAKDVSLQSLRHVGQKKNHLKFSVHKGNTSLPAIAFDVGSSNHVEGMKADVLFYIRINEWNGNREVQLTVQKILSDTRQ